MSKKKAERTEAVKAKGDKGKAEADATQPTTTITKGKVRGTYLYRFLKVLIPVLLALALAHLYRRGSLVWRTEPALERPPALLNYAQFRMLFPRLRAPTTVEDSRRHLLFISDLLEVATANISYLIGRQTYMARQTPFRSDRTDPEQADILGQLEELNLTQIMLDLGLEEEGPIDGPVSLGSSLKTGGKVSKWLARTIQGEAHFDIPNYPLDAQPNPDRITHIDADLRDCSGSVHDQGHCGACYAFSWNSFAEWHYCRQAGGRQVDFSEQHLLDCGHLARLAGCREGYLTDAKEFSQRFGFHLESEYPYKGKQAKSCNRPEGSLAVKVADFKRVQVLRDEWEQLLLEQPILVQVHLPRDVMSYQRGVHPGTNCDKSMAHGMLLVGHGHEEGVPYWILKNSMGPRWGENGYLRLSREAPMGECFRTGFIGKFKFASLDQEAYYDFYDSLSFQPSEHIVEKPQVPKGALRWLQGGGRSDAAKN